MNKCLLTLLFALTSSIGLSQSARITVKVLDSDTETEIRNANVEVEQIPGIINVTDDRGITIFNSVPAGRITIRVSAVGYVPQTFHYNNVSVTESKNNYYITKIVKIATPSEYLIYGEVTSNGEDIENAIIEIKALDKVKTTISDVSGNYSIKIPKSIASRVSEIKIEVKSKGCATLRKEIPVLANLNIHQDLKLECNGESRTTSVENSSNFYPIQKEMDFATIKIVDIKRTNRGIEVDLKVFNKDRDRSISLYSGRLNGVTYQTKINNEGDVYLSNSVQIGNDFCNRGEKDGCGTNTQVLKDAWIKAKVTFENMPQIKKIPILSVCFYSGHGGYMNLVARDLPIN